MTRMGYATLFARAIDYSKFRQDKRGHWKYCGFGVELLTPERMKRARKPIYGAKVSADWFPTHCDSPNCNDPITIEDGHSANFYPKQQKMMLMHYTCAWQNLFAKIVDLGRAV